MSSKNPLSFIESAEIFEAVALEATLESAGDAPVPIDLDRLPKGVVTGNTLIDYSATSEPIRGGLSLALAFANRAAVAAVGPNADEDEFFAAYKSNLGTLGFNVSQGAFFKSSFKKKGVAVHKAIIPFLTAALGGAAVGPVILALLNNLQSMDSDNPWITLFDRESRRFETREVNFAAAASDSVETRMRHVAARLFYVDTKTNVLFFKIDDASADFESTTTTLSINNALLASLEPALRGRLAASANDFIRAAAFD
jgi:hypothetical protein